MNDWLASPDAEQRLAAVIHSTHPDQQSLDDATCLQCDADEARDYLKRLRSQAASHEHDFIVVKDEIGPECRICGLSPDDVAASQPAEPVE